MAAKPIGTMRIMPALTEGQVDSICQRLEAAWTYPGSGALDLTVPQMAAVLFTAFPEQFDGDHHESIALAAAMRAVNGGARPMPNGYVYAPSFFEIASCTAKRRKQDSMTFDCVVKIGPKVTGREDEDE